MNSTSQLSNLIGAFMHVCVCVYVYVLICLSVYSCSYTFNISSKHKTTLYSKLHLISKIITTNISGQQKNLIWNLSLDLNCSSP